MLYCSYLILQGDEVSIILTDHLLDYLFQSSSEYLPSYLFGYLSRYSLDFVLDVYDSICRIFTKQYRNSAAVMAFVAKTDKKYIEPSHMTGREPQHRQPTFVQFRKASVKYIFSNGQITRQRTSSH